MEGFNMDKINKIKLKDFDKLWLVLSRQDYWSALVIKNCHNKHNGLIELLKHQEVIDYINENY